MLLFARGKPTACPHTANASAPSLLRHACIATDVLSRYSLRTTVSLVFRLRPTSKLGLPAKTCYEAHMLSMRRFRLGRDSSLRSSTRPQSFRISMLAKSKSFRAPQSLRTSRSILALANASSHSRMTSSGLKPSSLQPAYRKSTYVLCLQIDLRLIAAKRFFSSTRHSYRTLGLIYPGKTLGFSFCLEYTT